MRAAAVIYVGDLERMRAFYQQCFGLSTADSGRGYQALTSDAWLLTLVRSPDALPLTSPPPRRANTPIKLAFEVGSINQLRTTVTGLGGQVSPAQSEWEFRSSIHCDCVDPEGNVISLVQPKQAP